MTTLTQHNPADAAPDVAPPAHPTSLWIVPEPDQVAAWPTGRFAVVRTLNGPIAWTDDPATVLPGEAIRPATALETGLMHLVRINLARPEDEDELRHLLAGLPVPADLIAE